MRMRITLPTTAFLAVSLLWPGFARAAGEWGGPPPWESAGLDERQAAAHLIDRFTYGPRPGDLDRVLEIGIYDWIEGQLAGDFPGAAASAALARHPMVSLPLEEIHRLHPLALEIATEAIEAGVITRADYSGRLGERRRRAAVAELAAFSKRQGYRTASALTADLLAQKLYRAVYSESQLVEVLTEFWFNHFNVSINSHESRIHILAYERDAIRTHVLGSFRELLGATAKHPAMLNYLSNARSIAPAGATTAFDPDTALDQDTFSPSANPTQRLTLRKFLSKRKRYQAGKGLNENYARELLELHTLGVDGGYTQSDVIEVARAFTGWTTLPADRRRRLRRALEQDDALQEMGFVSEGGFLFRPDRHDSDEKRVLGVMLPAGRGIEDGEEVLDLLVRHPSAWGHLARKMAVRFVSDDPPASLVQRLIRTFELSGGDLREMMRALVRSPEFWRQESRTAKIKTPVELVVSALRSIGAEVSAPQDLLAWIRRMGQPLYAYAAPTGYPDQGEAWTDVGAMLARVNFAFSLANGKVRGVSYDPLWPAGERLLKSEANAVSLYFPALLPGRDVEEALAWMGEEAEDGDEETVPEPQDPDKLAHRQRGLAVYAGAILLASPEFQKR